MIGETSPEQEIKDLTKRVAELTNRSAAKTNEIRGLSLANGKLISEMDEVRTFASALLSGYQGLASEGSKKERLTIPVKDGFGVPHLFVSDTHFDETINSNEMNGLNRYDREIATRRLDKVFDEAIREAKSSFYKSDTFICVLGGDMISGDIHEELAKTNEHTTMETVVYWTNQLIGHIKRLEENFKNVIVPCISGNHDRNTFKTPFKKRAQESFSWIMYSWIKSAFEDSSGVSIEVSETPEYIYEVGNKTYVAVHGDNLRASGGGVSGLAPGLIKSIGKMFQRIRSTQSGVCPDWCFIGHYHSRLVYEAYDLGFIVNDSIKGYDEYARGHDMGYSPAAQVFCILTNNGPKEIRYIEAGD